MAIDNKLSNIIGTKIPQWVINQLSVRSAQNARLDKRDNDNLVYLANKTAWVRLVSSVNISANDLDYFSKLVPNVSKPEDLAKQYVLFGGTSVYINQTGQPSYNIRSGISGIKPNLDVDGAYGMLGRSEIQDYGYRPMPGITSVNIETQGRLGSVRQAIINFKCWDKAQIDIIDALYFKLGYSMFLEWGHTYYYPSATNPNDPENEQVNKLKSTEFSIVDPFAPNLTKETIFRQIAVNSRQSAGNYDAMLGIVTNFNFSYNQEGGYDCTLRLMSLGVLGDSIKINNPSILPDILRDEVLQLSDTLRLVSTAGSDVGGVPNIDPNDPNSEYFSIYAYLNYRETRPTAPPGSERRIRNFKGLFEPKDDGGVEYINIITKYGVLNSLYAEPRGKSPGTLTSFQLDNKDKYDFIYDDVSFTGPTLYLQKFGLRIPEKNPELWVKSVTLDKDRLYNVVNKSYINFLNNQNKVITQNEYLFQLKDTKGNPYLYESKALVYEVGSEEGAFIDFNSVTQRNETIYPNRKKFYLYIKINIPEELFSLGNIKGQKSAIIINGKKFSARNQNVNVIGTSVLARPLFQESGGAQGLIQDLQISDEVLKDILNKIVTPGSDLNLSGTPKVSNLDIRKTFEPFLFSVSGVYNLNVEAIVNGSNPDDNSAIETLTNQNYSISWEVSTTDTSLIKEITPLDTLEKTQLFSEYYKIKQDEQVIIQQNIQEQQQQQQKELATQVAEALSYQSALEIILRTIQVKSLNQAFYQTGKVDLEIGRKVYKFEMWKKRNRPFLNQILSNGIYSGIIETLIDNPESISNTNYKTDEDKFLVNAKYGFATTLLGSDSKDPFENLVGKEVNYSEILNAYVVPYQIDQEIVAGVKTNHPVYVPFGLLVFLLNHVCSLYDTALESSAEESAGTSVSGAQQRALASASRLAKVKQKPLVYLDYNPNLNFFLTNPQQLSTNPWVALIPYEGRFDDYRKLFDQDVIDNNSIRPLSGSQQSTPLFNPETQDLLSWQLPKVKDSADLYRGKLMNVLINIDYLTSLVKDYSFKDGTNNVFLKPFLEHILSDVNKYLGNFNALRLSYNDRANTFQFVDDQYIPSLPNEPQIPYKPNPKDIQNRTEIPLVGRDSIAKSFELKTEISSRLASMLAISANANPNEQVQNSVNGDSFGFLNKNYSDRYIPRRLSAGDEKTAQKEGEKTTSIQFNQTISDFYSKINPAYSDVSQATSFFINKMSVQKNQASATRSSVLIPVGANIGLDGIGGLTMGQAFTISDRLLPYNYYSNNPGNIFDGYVNQVGFVIVGLSHVIDNNTWTTNIRTQMMPVKDNSLFGTPPPVLKKNEGAFGINEYNIINATNANRLREVLASLQYLEKGNELANAGDITPKLMSEAAALFREIKNTYPNLIIQVTGGNDIFHLNRSDSRHKSGNGLDFIIVNGTDQDVINVGNLVAEFAKKYQISYKDEYDESKQSAGATGNHFHISV